MDVKSIKRMRGGLMKQMKEKRLFYSSMEVPLRWMMRGAFIFFYLSITSYFLPLFFCSSFSLKTEHITHKYNFSDDETLYLPPLLIWADLEVMNIQLKETNMVSSGFLLHLWSPLPSKLRCKFILYHFSCVASVCWF